MLANSDPDLVLVELLGRLINPQTRAPLAAFSDVVADAICAAVWAIEDGGIQPGGMGQPRALPATSLTTLRRPGVMLHNLTPTLTPGPATWPGRGFFVAMFPPGRRRRAGEGRSAVCSRSAFLGK